MEDVRTSLGFESSLIRSDLSEGTLSIAGILVEDYAVFIDRELRLMMRNRANNTDTRPPLSVQLFSGGGGVFPAFHIYDSLRAYSENVGPVTVVVSGFAASAAAGIVLQAGDRRLITPKGRLMLHEVGQWYMHGTSIAVSQQEDNAREMRVLQEMMCNLLAEKTNKDADYWQQTIYRKDTWYSATEAVELGLVDAIANGEKLGFAA